MVWECHTGEMMKEQALTSSTLFNAYRILVSAQAQ